MTKNELQIFSLKMFFGILNDYFSQFNHNMSLVREGFI